jgi:hypothetical protein
MKKIIYFLALVLILNSSFLIQNCQSQWVPTNGSTGGFVFCFAVSGTNLFAGTLNGGVFKSTDNGVNWSAVNSGLSNPNVNALAVLGTNLFAGTYGGGVFLSTNNGANWTSAGLLNQYVQSFAVSGTNLFAGTNNGGVFLTTNNGISWTTVGLTTLYINALAVSGTNLFAGTNNGVFLSTNNGNTWTAVNNGLTYQQVFTFGVSGTNLFAGTNGGVFLSTNNGTSWTASGLASLYVYSFSVSGTNLFTGTDGGVFLTTNNGSFWFNKNQGFNPVPKVYAILAANDYVIAGTDNQSVWRRSLSEVISVQNISTEIPSKYSLSQNYPNPFNPTTKIKFELPSLEGYGVRRGVGLVKLTVYDVMGREVQTLINENLQPGTYESSFDASTLNSGVYFYKISAGDYSETKKMLMIK